MSQSVKYYDCSEDPVDPVGDLSISTDPDPISTSWIDYYNDDVFLTFDEVNQMFDGEEEWQLVISVTNKYMFLAHNYKNKKWVYLRYFWKNNGGRKGEYLGYCRQIGRPLDLSVEEPDTHV